MYAFQDSVISLLQEEEDHGYPGHFPKNISQSLPTKFVSYPREIFMQGKHPCDIELR